MKLKVNEWLQRKVKYWQAILIILGFVLITFLTTCSVTRTTEQFQYENISRQKVLVDNRVEKVESKIRELDDRISITESKVNTSLTDTNRVLTRLERLMYQASPEVMTELARNSLNINQTASPVINVNTPDERKANQQKSKDDHLWQRQPN